MYNFHTQIVCLLGSLCITDESSSLVITNLVVVIEKCYHYDFMLSSRTLTKMLVYDKETVDIFQDYFVYNMNIFPSFNRFLGKKSSVRYGTQKKIFMLCFIPQGVHTCNGYRLTALLSFLKSVPQVLGVLQGWKFTVFLFSWEEGKREKKLTIPTT